MPPTFRAVSATEAQAYVWDTNAQDWVPMTQPGGSEGGGTVTQGPAGASPWLITGDVAALVTGSVTATISGTPTVTGPLTDSQLRAAAVPVSGTFFQATQPVSVAAPLTVAQATPGNLQATVTAAGAFPVTAPTLTKGTQDAAGFSVQALKDAGRTAVNFYAVAAAAGSTGTETAITLTKSSGTGATTTGTSFVVTSGKRFRIEALSVATRGHTTATAQVTTFALRLNTNGAVATNTTPVLLSVRSATPATSLAWDRVIVPLPDGFEIVGTGTLQIGITANAVYTTNAPTWDVTLVGYEY